MPASTKTAEPQAPPRARWLIGLRSEDRELALRLAERPELLVIESDPLSGASILLAHAIADPPDRSTILVDARVSGSALDLAMAIATAGIAQLAPQAASWWNGAGTFDVEGLRLSRTPPIAGSISTSCARLRRRHRAAPPRPRARHRARRRRRAYSRSTTSTTCSSGSAPTTLAPCSACSGPSTSAPTPSAAARRAGRRPPRLGASRPRAPALPRGDTSTQASETTAFHR